MKIRREFYKQSMRAIGIVAVCVLGILSTLGSGGGGGDDSSGGTLAGSTPSSVKAFNFDASNTLTAAQLAASAMSFFPEFTAVSQEIIDILTTSTPGNSPFDLSAGCNGTGSAQLSWNDADASNDLSQGDTATLQLTGCDLDGSGATVTGTVGFTVSGAVNSGPAPNSIPFNISVNLQVNDAGSTTTIAGEFGDTLSTSDNITYTNAFTANDAANQMIAVTENGNPYLQFGCFSVTQTFSLGNSGTYGLSASGVINASNAILSLAGGAQLSFVSNNMEAGTKRLLSLSVPECAALGVPTGVGDSDGSYIDMEALGGGNIRLHTFDSTNTEIHSEDTTYNALLN